MGTETLKHFNKRLTATQKTVKLNNPQMGTETKREFAKIFKEFIDARLN